MYRARHRLLKLTIKIAGQVVLLLASAFMLQACCKCERKFGAVPRSIPAHPNGSSRNGDNVVAWRISDAGINSQYDIGFSG